MCQAVANCLVFGYEPLVDGLSLPDPNDRHVLAAAIRCSAQVIVTANLRDFPRAVLEPFNIEAKGPDQFVLDLVDLAPARVATVIERQAAALTRPCRTVDELLDELAGQGLPRAAAALRSYLDA